VSIPREHGRGSVMIDPDHRSPFVLDIVRDLATTACGVATVGQSRTMGKSRIALAAACHVS
jgi:hypothetical protein